MKPAFRWNRAARRRRTRCPWWRPGRPTISKRLVALIASNAVTNTKLAAERKDAT